jgi:hypothetical protein
MKEFKHYIKLILRIHKYEDLPIDEACNNIYDFAKNSKMFHYKSFVGGFILGGIVWTIVVSMSM